jgi:acyl carrier protein
MGEIEAHLDRHPSVQASVVHPVPDGENVQLVAYIKRRVADADNGEFDKALRRFLLLSLPEYMVPSAFVTINEFPTTANGKIDRRALAALSPTPRRTREKDGEGPQTEIESAVAEIWRAVLNVDFVGVEENFFDLGGNSLLIERVRLALVERFDVDLAIVSMFEYPTVRAVARMIAAARSSPGLVGADSERAQNRYVARRARQDVRRRLDLGGL